jgi:sarcosine oxidase subunit gamma
MSRISPLQNAHNKGLFGDYQEKNEGNLLKIREITDVNIYQVVQYKKSSVATSNIQLGSINLPTNAAEVSADGQTRVQWFAPRSWIIFSNDDNISSAIENTFNDKDFAVTDVSHSRVIIQIEGDDALNILKKGCPINFNEFKKNNCVNSVYHGITISVDMIDDSPLTFNLMALRSFSESFHHAITDAALEYGYSGE